MSFKEKLKNLMAPEDTEDEIEMTREEAASLSDYEKPGTTDIPDQTNIVLFEPRHFDEAEEIARHIKSRRACCVNFHRMPAEYRSKAVDFLSGVIFGVDGSIRKIGDEVILCSPKNLMVGGTINLNDNSND